MPYQPFLYTPSHTCSQFSIREYILTLVNKVFVDRNFQRRPWWSLERKQAFIKAVFEGANLHAILLGDVESGREVSERDRDELSYQKYHSAWKDDKKFVSLDGQNRVSTMWEFLNNKFRVTGTFIDEDGVRHHLVGTLFKEMPQRLQDKFNNSKLNVTVARYFKYEELSSLFLSNNSDQSLEPAERRNAYNTPFSTVIREFSETDVYSALSDRIVKPEGKLRMEDVELFCLMYISILSRQDFEWGQKDPAIEKLFNIGIGKFLDSVPEYSHRHFSKFQSIMDIMCVLFDNISENNHQGKGKVPKAITFSMLHVAEFLYENNVDITTLETQKLRDIWKKVTDLEKELVDSSVFQKMRDDLEYDQRTMEYKKSNPAPSESEYYKKWSATPHQYSHQSRKREKFISEIKKMQVFKDLLKNIEVRRHA